MDLDSNMRNARYFQPRRQKLAGFPIRPVGILIDQDFESRFFFILVREGLLALYGGRRHEFVEIHHLIPVASLEAERVVDPYTEMAVLCSNCYRVIDKIRSDPL